MKIKIYLNLILCSVFLFGIACYIDTLSGLKFLKKQDSIIKILLGDTRQVFKNMLIRKADIYLHSGYYPSFFEKAVQKELEKQQGKISFIKEESHDKKDKNHDKCKEKHHGTRHDDDEHGWKFFKTEDWISHLNKQKRPPEHYHLEAGRDGMARQLIPWLKISNMLSPEDELTILLLVYWLYQLEKNDQAIKLLLDGISINPDSYLLYTELAHMQFLSGYDTQIAKKNLLTAIKKWNKTKWNNEKKDFRALIKIYLYIIAVCEKNQEYNEAIFYLKKIKKIYPNKDIESKLGYLIKKSKQK